MLRKAIPWGSYQLVSRENEGDPQAESKSGSCSNMQLLLETELEESDPEGDELVPNCNEREAKEESKNAAKLRHQKGKDIAISLSIFSQLVKYIFLSCMIWLLVSACNIRQQEHTRYIVSCFSLCLICTHQEMSWKMIVVYIYNFLHIFDILQILIYYHSPGRRLGR